MDLPDSFADMDLKEDIFCGMDWMDGPFIPLPLLHFNVFLD